MLFLEYEDLDIKQKQIVKKLEMLFGNDPEEMVFDESEFFKENGSSASSSTSSTGITEKSSDISSESEEVI